MHTGRCATFCCCDNGSPSRQNQVNVRMVALLQDTKSQVLDRIDNQSRMQTNATLTLVETIRAEATEVIKVIQDTNVQTRARSLSMHSQVEPDGFASLTTRVRRRPLAVTSLTRIDRSPLTPLPRSPPSLSYRPMLHSLMTKSTCVSRNTRNTSNRTLRQSNSLRCMER